MLNQTEYLLTCLAEEAAEIVQAATKALRFGLDDRYPENGATTAERLAIELDQLTAVADLLRDKDIIGRVSLRRISDKLDKLHKWRDYSRKKGTLEPDSVPFDGCNDGERGAP